MTKASVLGIYMNQSTGKICTVMKFANSDSADAPCYVTDEPEYVEPLRNEPSKFVNAVGQVLVATA
ncbi:hypothetical protein [uncultured Oxalicibacterium sp.]|uniref:hypothetical protein n=1 Tax=uncultured Oxalicibacterium sp. TaxID=1168540 RepID=UPI0025F54EDB|nr:hypothetical protein [uncultured Oxalicibacterium sp.]